eukprot:scaffold13825_cov83-Skeletonema_menzelii.AAC.8
MQERPQIKGDSHAMDPQLLLPRKTEPDVFDPSLSVQHMHGEGSVRLLMKHCGKRECSGIVARVLLCFSSFWRNWVRLVITPFCMLEAQEQEYWKMFQSLVS